MGYAFRRNQARALGAHIWISENQGIHETMAVTFKAARGADVPLWLPLHRGMVWRIGAQSAGCADQIALEQLFDEIVHAGDE